MHKNVHKYLLFNKKILVLSNRNTSYLNRHIINQKIHTKKQTFSKFKIIFSNLQPDMHPATQYLNKYHNLRQTQTICSSNIEREFKQSIICIEQTSRTKTRLRPQNRMKPDRDRAKTGNAQKGLYNRFNSDMCVFFIAYGCPRSLSVTLMDFSIVLI